ASGSGSESKGTPIEINGQKVYDLESFGELVMHMSEDDYKKHVLSRKGRVLFWIKSKNKDLDVNLNSKPEVVKKLFKHS
ncbi:MAG: hypothetical protein ACQEP1_05815, partial [Nanobdellota archaeon]